MSKSPPRRASEPRTGPKPRIDLRAIVAAGLAHDLSTLTLTDVARDLGVTHPAIYRYVDSSQDLLLECLAEIMRTTDWPEPDGSWQDQVLRFAACLWSACDEHPGLAQVMFSVPAAPPTGHGPMARVVRGLIDAGLRPDLALLAVDFVGDTVFSTHLGVAVRRGIDGAIPDQTFGVLPEATAALLEQAPGASEDGLLQLKLELIVEAIERRNRGARSSSVDPR